MNSDISQTHSKETDAALIRAELDRLLKERRFSGAPQMSAFLRYIVNETLAGNADRIKAYSVGVDALGKPDTFDAQTDPSVRVLALRLRKTLSAVYADTTSCYAVIELKVGTYVPVFYIAKPTAQTNGTDRGNSSSESSAAANMEDPKPGSFRPVEAYQPASSERDRANGVAVRSIGGVKASSVQRSMQAEQNARPGGSRFLTGSPTGSPQFIGGGNTLANMGRLWPILIAFALLAVAWQISITRNSINGPTLVSSMFSKDIPTIYLALPKSGPLADPGLEQRILMMLSTRFVQSGTVNVVRHTLAEGERQYGPGEYRLLIDGFNIDQRLRIDTQIVNLSDGEMLYADSLMVSEPGNMLSSGDVGSIEEMASGIVSVDGPLHEDYCIKYRNGDDETSACPMS